MNLSILENNFFLNFLHCWNNNTKAEGFELLFFMKKSTIKSIVSLDL